MLGPYTGIIESSRHRVGFKDLSVVVLHKIGAVTVEYARTADRQRGCVLTGFETLAPCLNAIHRNALILQKRMKEPNGVGAAADTGHQGVRQLAVLSQTLRPRFTANDALKVAHEHGVRMRAGDRANNVKGIVDIRDPVAHGFIHGVFQRTRTRSHRDNLRSQELHSIDIQRLSANVFLTHKNVTLETQPGCNRRAGDTMLTRTRLGNHPLLAHIFGEECLPDRVIHLVGTGVIQIFALEQDACAADGVRQPGRLIQW